MTGNTEYDDTAVRWILLHWVCPSGCFCFWFWACFWASFWPQTLHAWTSWQPAEKKVDEFDKTNRATVCSILAQVIKKEMWHLMLGLCRLHFKWHFNWLDTVWLDIWLDWPSFTFACTICSLHAFEMWEWSPLYTTIIYFDERSLLPW